MRLGCDMHKSSFRIVPLPTEIAEAARRKARAGATDHIEMTADAPNAYPCRHCLKWAQPGEQVVLFPFASVPAGRPYSESGPIFVHADNCLRYSTVEDYPANFREHRVIRAYNAGDNMIDAVMVADQEPEEVIKKLFENPGAAFLQARSVTRGCYTFRIERA
jgi:Protein of unknown function (DUF1203)